MNEDNKKDIVISVIKFLIALKIDEKTRDKIIYSLSEYVDLMIEWEATHNVVSNNQTGNDLWVSIYDSICFIGDENDRFYGYVCDIKDTVDAGSGGGFPGIPLSIILTHKKFILIDSSRKKCSFLRHVKAQLGLHNVEVRNDNINNLTPVPLIVTKAAFSPPHANLLARAAAPGGFIALWSTPMSAETFITAFKPYHMSLLDKKEYQLPSNKERTLLLFAKKI